MTELEAKLVMKDAENSELRLRLGRNGTLPIVDGSGREFRFDTARMKSSKKIGLLKSS